jgi:ribonuclease P protein component
LPRAIAVGLVVRKKFIPNAVHRNRCKRLLREVLREQMKTHEELFSEISAMIVIWNSTSAESNPSAVTQHHRLRITDVEFSIHEALLNSHSFVHQP